MFAWCGPGTGIASFRAFSQDRKAMKAPGRNWLFGHRRRASDFFYEDELNAMKQDVTDHGGRSVDKAVAHVASPKKAGRYQANVY
jgi:hypothetical protein